MKKHRNITLLAITLSAFLFSFFTGTDNLTLDRIIAKFSRYQEIYSQQKLFVHTDKDIYQAGEIVCIKVYVTNVQLQNTDTTVQNIYAEIIAPDKKTVITKILKLKNGIAYQIFNLPDTIHAGNYQLRAYTSFQKNFDNEMLFAKDIRIENTKSVFATKTLYKQAKKMKADIANVEFTLFPEGGYLVTGLQSTVAFKATDCFGNGIQVEGTLVDNKGYSILNFKSEHGGMGSFVFTPQKDAKYKAVLTSHKNVNTELPQPLATGYTLNISKNGNNMVMDVASNKTKSNDDVANTVYVTGISNGKMIISYEKILDSNNKAIFFADLSLFPTGVVQFTLFNGFGAPQCERLYFVNKHDNANVSIVLNKQTYNTKEPVNIGLDIIDNAGNKTGGNLSVSISPANTSIAGNQSSIFKYMLLSSEIKGKIENIDWYFEKPENEKYIDLLMLTQGWRRYDWEVIMQEKELPQPSFTHENSISVSGYVGSDLMDIPAQNSNVTLTVMGQYNDAFVAKTDQKGKFFFDNLNYYDSIEVLIECWNSKGNKWGLIEKDEITSPDVYFNPIKGIDTAMLHTKGKMRYYKKQPRTPYMRNSGSLHSMAEHTIIVTETMANSARTVFDILQGRIPGMSVNGNQVQIRGKTSMTMNTEPLFLIDNVYSDANGVSTVNPKDVERIDVLKNPGSAAVYGSRGINGVIAIYTKKGTNKTKGELLAKINGYAHQKQYYNPGSIKTDMPLAGLNNYSTIYWNANVQVSKDEPCSFEFTPAVSDVVYNITVQGLTSEGKPVFVLMPLKVD